MARKAILDTYYTFTPSTRTIVLPRAVQKERLILITDVTTNQVIYNFSDPNLTSTSYVVATSPDGITTTTTITLAYNTTALSATDKLSIVIDEYDEKFSPSETYLDPINKLRVSTPQSLIDTDYEYSIQTTKWEQLALLNNRSFGYYVTATGLLTPTITDIQANNGSRVFTAYTTGTPPAVGSAIYVSDSITAVADGVYIVDSNTASTFNWTGKYYYTGVGQQSIYNSGVTNIYQGGIFSNTAIAVTNLTVSAQTSGATANVVTVTTTQPHGLVIGNEIALTGMTAATSGSPNGSFFVAQVINPNTFNFIQSVNGPSVGALTPTGTMYVRPQGQAVHRPFDGGVRFSTNASSHNQQYIRQTRRYFRYQSGKGIQMSTGTTLKPQFNLDGITYSSANNQVTVTTKDPHNIQAGINVQIVGVNESGYNGIYTISNIVSPFQFNYIPTTPPSVAVASGSYYASAYSWYGSSNRIGIFDSQNGLYWEFDGQTLYAVKRNSTFQIAGTISATPGSSYITGTNTTFTKQLTVGDFIVIKGMSYRVLSIFSDTSLTVSPSFRGITPITNAQCSRTVDLRIAQSNFNIDRLDGTGPSGYNIDLTKMQMFYVDYSWYGAGFVRWGVRGPDGNVIYCHKMINNNVNYLAYMRSGNLPGRYETNTLGKFTFMTGGASGIGTNLNVTDTTITVANTFGFANAGTLLLRGPANTEYVNYTGISNTSFTGLTRGQAGNNSIWFTTVGGNNTLTLASSNGTGGIQVGQFLFGPNIPTGSFVTSYTPNTNITISIAPTSTMTLASNAAFYPMANLAQTFSYSASAQTSVELHAPQFAPEINHWGTSAIMDGGFTADKSFIFTKGMTVPVNVQPGTNTALMSFRVAPSASSGIPGANLGAREIINRMQLIPFETDMYANQGFLVTCYLNATANNTTNNWTNVGGSSLSQYVFHSNPTTVSGGEAVFGFFLNVTPGTYATTQQDLSQLLALGHSIQGGGNANTNIGIYPDGPDMLTFVVTNLGPSAGNVQARFSWTEAQA